jgi:hypothetical protein
MDRLHSQTSRFWRHLSDTPLLRVCATAGVFMLGAQIFSYSSSADSTAEQETTPLPLASAGSIPEPPASSSCGADWKSGYEQALSGQFHTSHFTTQITAERRACNTFRKGAHANSSDAHELECCLAGYGKGLPALKDMIAELHERKQQGITTPAIDSREQQCLKEFKLGRAASEFYCRKLLGIEQMCFQLKADAAYPACYNLGFFLAAEHCEAREGKQIQDYLKAQRLSDSRVIKNFNDAPFDPEALKNEATAGSAQDTAPTGVHSP